MNSLSVNFRGISFLSTVKQWLLHAQMYCTSYALADENTSLRQNRTLEAEAGLFPAVSMLWGDSPKGSPFPFSLCFCQVIQSPFKPSRLCLSAVVFVRENCVCQWPPLPSWTQLNRRRKLSQEELKIHSSLRFFFFFSLTCGYNKGDAPLLEKIHIQENQPGTSLNPWIDFKE